MGGVCGVKADTFVEFVKFQEPNGRHQTREVEKDAGTEPACGVVCCGVVWCGVVWCGVVWCGVVWCGVGVW